MNSFEINKIIAAIILTIVIVFGVNKLADVIYYVKAPKDNTYKIVAETEEISKDDTVKAGGDNNISAILALGNIDHGKMIFKKCAACHSASKGGGNKIGPALWGVIGRKAGSISDYKYSKAMSGFGKIWDFEGIGSAEALRDSLEAYYITNNLKYHNAFNGGEQNRVHLVACLTDYKFN